MGGRVGFAQRHLFAWLVLGGGRDHSQSLRTPYLDCTVAVARCSLLLGGREEDGREWL